MDTEAAMALLQDYLHGYRDVIDEDAQAALGTVARELNRLRGAEEALRARCARLERAAVGGGVLSGDVSTHAVREAFGWERLPQPLARHKPLLAYERGARVEVCGVPGHWSWQWVPARVERTSAEVALVRLETDDRRSFVVREAARIRGRS